MKANEAKPLKVKSIANDIELGHHRTDIPNDETRAGQFVWSLDLSPTRVLLILIGVPESSFMLRWMRKGQIIVICKKRSPSVHDVTRAIYNDVSAEKLPIISSRKNCCRSESKNDRNQVYNHRRAFDSRRKLMTSEISPFALAATALSRRNRSTMVFKAFRLIINHTTASSEAH